MQSKCIQQAWSSDVIAALKTGYGKSLIFETLACYKTQSFQPVVIIISPLNAIIKEQLERYGDKAVQINPEFLKTLQIHRCEVESKCQYCCFKTAGGDISFLLGHPEHFMDRSLFEIFASDCWQDKVQYVVVDEAHCIDKWGNGFRKDFGDLSRLRSIFPKANMLALTGTATEKTISVIKSSLNLTDPTILKTSIVRNNIDIRISRKPKDTDGTDAVYEKVMTPYFRDLEQMSHEYPKTIVFSKLKYCGLGYSLVEREGSHISDGTKIAAQYHSPCTEQMKQDVQLGMKENNIRMLFATEAYSMGTDSADIRQIIHFGVPYTLETYLQETGRAGRDGQPATARMYYNKNYIATNCPCDESMREFVNTEECRWKFVSQHFSETVDDDYIQDHNCCDNCAKACTCPLCNCNTVHSELQPSLSSSSCSIKLGKSKRNILHSMLETYVHAENNAAGIPNSEILTGLDSPLIEEICKNAVQFLKCNSFVESFPCLKELYVNNIISIIDHVIKQ